MYRQQRNALSRNVADTQALEMLRRVQDPQLSDEAAEGDGRRKIASLTRFSLDHKTVFERARTDLENVPVAMNILRRLSADPPEEFGQRPAGDARAYVMYNTVGKDRNGKLIPGYRLDIAAIDHDRQMIEGLMGLSA